MTKLTRRHWMSLTPGALAAALASAPIMGRRPAAASAAPPEDSSSPFRYCLNTSTIRAGGEPLPVDRQVAIAAEAGYDGIEPWIRDLDRHAERGGSLEDLGRRIADLGLAVESAIGFFPWAVDDDAERAKGLEEARRSMEVLAKIGGKRIAAPPSGATDTAGLDLDRLGERYRALLEVGERVGVVPQLEVWGFSKTLGRLGEAVHVAVASGRPDACLLPDVYHLYKGGSPFGGLALLNGSAIRVFHLNDYPADPPREAIGDADRVYPGDGVAPLGTILRTLRDIGFRGALSLELFNRTYWQQDPMEVARTGLEKMRAAVRDALAG